MANLKEKVAYLQGLTQGLNVSSQSSEGKLLLNIIDVLDDVAEEFGNMHAMHHDLENYIETIDEDLTELEEEIYEEDNASEEFVEVQCPSCHETVNFESDILEEDDAVEVTCPYCGEIVYDNTLEVDNFVEDNDVGMDFNRAIHPGV